MGMLPKQPPQLFQRQKCCSSAYTLLASASPESILYFSVSNDVKCAPVRARGGEEGAKLANTTCISCTSLILRVTNVSCSGRSKHKIPSSPRQFCKASGCPVPSRAGAEELCSTAGSCPQRQAAARRAGGAAEAALLR